MTFKTDYAQLNAADDPVTDFTYSSWNPTLNDSSANTPIYIEGSSCAWWPLSKGVTEGYAYCSVTGSMAGRLLVWYWNMALADIYNIPLDDMRIRICSTSWTSNYSEWEAKGQIPTPYNVPISGHVPMMVYPTNPGTGGYFLSNGTLVPGSLSHVGMVGNTGSTTDGKQGGFDMMFVIGYIGEHSATYTNTFFDELYEQSYNDGGSPVLPINADRPLGVISRAGDFFQTNVNIQIGSGATPNDTASIIVSETGKTIFFSNIEADHALGYIFVDPTGVYVASFTITDCVHFWTSQPSTADIFTNATNAQTFKLVGCSFANGGKITLPPDSALRWVRNTKFSSCQTGSASNGEFTDCILSGCYTMAISGDADFTGTSVLAPAVATDDSGIEWNGNYDPDGNLDDMTFTKGANAHHAIEFGTAAPLTMTIRGMTNSGFNASNGQNDSTFYIANTNEVVVTINIVGGTGNFSYKSAGATVVIAVSVPVTITVNDKDGNPIENVQTAVYKTSDRTQIMNEDTTALGVATESYGGTTPVEVEVLCRKSSPGATKYINYSSIQTIGTGGLDLSVTMFVNPNNNS